MTPSQPCNCRVSVAFLEINSQSHSVQLRAAVVPSHKPPFTTTAPMELQILKAALTEAEKKVCSFIRFQKNNSGFGKKDCLFIRGGKKNKHTLTSNLALAQFEGRRPKSERDSAGLKLKTTLFSYNSFQCKLWIEPQCSATQPQVCNPLSFLQLSRNGW